ncbi:hypothetical protein ACODT5_45865 [Streptomyces sp. 5.8]|uniref:hypothetical protein n=1 Tax=Streptomyces sp. 5.8 TaxID=3406571 RepID=UPI003BB7D2B2
MEWLRKEGTPHFDVETVPGTLGFEAETTRMLKVHPARLARVGATLGATQRCRSLRR